MREATRREPDILATPTSARGRAAKAGLALTEELGRRADLEVWRTFGAAAEAFSARAEKTIWNRRESDAWRDVPTILLAVRRFGANSCASGGRRFRKTKKRPRGSVAASAKRA